MPLHQVGLPYLALDPVSARNFALLGLPKKVMSTWHLVLQCAPALYLTAAASCVRWSAVSRVQSRLVLLRSMLTAKNLASSEGSSSSVTAIGHASAELLKLVSQAEAAPCWDVSWPYKVCIANSTVCLVSSPILPPLYWWDMVIRQETQNLGKIRCRL